MKRSKIHGKLQNALKQINGVLADKQVVGANHAFAADLTEVKNKLGPLVNACTPAKRG